MKKERNLLILFVVFIVLLLVFIGIKYINKSGSENIAEDSSEDIIPVLTGFNTITEIAYNVGNGEIALEYVDKQWYLKKDHNFPLNRSYAYMIADSFQSMAAQRVIEDPADTKEYGFDGKETKVYLTDANANKRIIEVGRQIEDNFYVMVQGESSVYLVNSSFMDYLNTPLNSLARLDEIPEITSENLNAFDIITPENSTSYSNADTGNIQWLTSVLAEVSLEEVVEYTLAKEDRDRYGLDEKTCEAIKLYYTSLVTKDDKELVIYIGGSDGNGNRYVTVDESTICYVVDENICSKLLNEE